MNSAYNIGSFEPYSQNIKIIKEYSKKKNTLLASVSRVLICLFCLSSSIITYSIANGATSSLLNYASKLTDQEKGSLAPFINGSSLLSIIISNLPAFIFLIIGAIAFINIFTVSKKEDISKTPVSGYRTIKILTIFELIITAIITLIIIAAFSVLGIALPFLSEKLKTKIDVSNITSIYSFAFIFSCVVCILILVFLIAKLVFFSSITKGLSSPNLSTKGAGLTSLFYMIFFALMVLVVIVSISALIASALFYNTLGTILDIDLSLLTPLAISELLFSLSIAFHLIVMHNFVSGYKKYVKQIKTAHLNNEEPSFSIDQNVNNNIDYEFPQWQVEESDIKETERQTITPEQKEEAFVCPSCGATFNEKIKFCTSCGQKIE